jgi:Xaa-Pro aminopeptidase
MSRLELIRSKLSDDESFLVSNPVNIRYLSGFTGSNGLLHISKLTAHLYTDSRYEIQATKEVSEFEVLISQDIWNQVTKGISSAVLCIEARHLTVGKLAGLKQGLPSLKFKECSDLVEQSRIRKDSTEIQWITKACEISVEALRQLTEMKLIGKTELELSTWLERKMIDLGATDKAFNTIVASGENSAIPHHQPTSRQIASGDLLKIDFGADYHGYKSDCTRTFAIGNAQTWQKEIHNAVRQGQSIGRELAAINAKISDVNQAVRNQIQQSGYGQYFTHGLGHGVGLEIHEDPFLSSKTADKITEDMVITVEPGIYLAESGGVRIEDTGVITTSGYEVLTKFTYELLELA